MTRSVLWPLLAIAVCGSAAAWLISEPMVVNWAAARAPAEPLARFEAQGYARAALSLARILFPLGVLLTLVGLRASRRLHSELTAAWCELIALSRVSHDRETKNPRPSLFATWTLRLILAAWLLLAGVQFAGSVDRRLAEWPVYRWNDGATVLPNMSDSNRDVIRYVSTATPEDARILVVSDQALFFVSYYLLPRRVFSKTHPDADRVIPQPGQERQLAAYRLEDLSAADIERIDPDYVLEYFEGSAYVESDRILEDPQWIRFLRQRYGDPGYAPAYQVVLTRRDREQSTP